MEFEKLVEIISNVLSCDPDNITPESRFIEDLDADSLDVVSIIMALEDEFGIEIADDLLENIKTVGNAVDAIKNTVG